MGEPSLPNVAAQPVTPLDAAARHVLKATLVPVTVAQPRLGTGDAILKHVTIDRLALAPGETEAVTRHMARASGNAPMHRGHGEDTGHHPDPQRRLETAGAPASQVSTVTTNLLRRYEDPLLPALRPTAQEAALIPDHELAAFADAVVAYRTDELREATPGGDRARIAELKTQLTEAVTAAHGFQVNKGLQPLGMLNLERIEMVPAGIQRGELVGTVPLAPGETTAVTHKEWSVVSKEFTTIVTDSLEKFSETGVTDTTDLSQSTTSQAQHSNQFNITGTVQGGIPLISGSSTTSFGGQDSTSRSAAESIKHATSVTQKASFRARTEHKVTISTKTETGTSETSTRILQNAGADPIRIDYFSLLRRWRVGLYRYGLRLTYDVVVPEPAATMRKAYIELERLRAAQAPFRFTVTHSDIQRGTYLGLADQWEAVVPPYPTDPPVLTPSATRPSGGGWQFLDIEWDVPSGAAIATVFVDTQIGDRPVGIQLCPAGLCRVT